MPNYRNKRTGAIVNVTSVLAGDWDLIAPIAVVHTVEAPAAKEAPKTEEAPKPKRTRTKKK